MLEIEKLGLERECSGIDACEIEDVVGDVEQGSRADPRDADAVSAFRRPLERCAASTS